MSEPTILQRAKSLLVEVSELKLGTLSRPVSGDALATVILQRAELRDTLTLLIAYTEGYQTGHEELLYMVKKLLSITREYQDSAGTRYLNLKPGTGTLFQQLLTDLVAYLETYKI